MINLVPFVFTFLSGFNGIYQCQYLSSFSVFTFMTFVKYGTRAYWGFLMFVEFQSSFVFVFNFRNTSKSI